MGRNKRKVLPVCCNVNVIYSFNLQQIKNMSVRRKPDVQVKYSMLEHRGISILSLHARKWVMTSKACNIQLTPRP